MTKIVEVNCIEHIYPDKTRIELCGLELTVNKGEKVAILGSNGSGKTTLIKHILGLLTPSKGLVSVFGKNPAKDFKIIRHKIGVVLQNIDEQLIGPTVIDDIMFSPLNFGYSKQEAQSMAENIMDELGIIHLKDKIIHYLSGGEKKKVAIAGALVHNPELLVLDEPFSNLDSKSERGYISLIDRICREKGISVIISTHNAEVLTDFADTIFLISKNHLSRKKTLAELFYSQDNFGQDNLEVYNLEKPTLIKMVDILKDRGIDLGNPVSAEEAADVVERLLGKP